MNNKIVIIGCGNVGMSYAYALLNQKTKVDELVLIDLNMDKVCGEVQDLNHGMAFAPSKLNIKAGDYSDCNDATIICICAGVNQKEGETRLDLVKNNNKVFKNIISNINKTNFNGIYLIATNPVDIMSYITMHHSKADKHRVIGSGTTLDTARLRFVIGERLNINSKNIHAYVIGEHGDTEFTPWSIASVGLRKLTDYMWADELDIIAGDIKTVAYDIINKKGSTHYGIGMCLVRITNAILGDESTILTVSNYDENNDIYIGMPAIIDKTGIREVINLDLNDIEKEKLNNSIKLLKQEVENIKECNND